MATDIREYLLDRFRTDASTLRQRATALKSANKPSPGPNAALSNAMAEACESVVALAEKLPEAASVEEILAALRAMLPQLNDLANAPESASQPAVRSVYAGASTRVQELITAEANAIQQAAGGVDDSESDEDDLLDEELDDDEDFDDDDLYDDDGEDDKGKGGNR